MPSSRTVGWACTLVIAGVLVAPATRAQSEEPEPEPEAEAEAEAATTGDAAQSRSKLYLNVAAGVGYASVSEDRPDAKGLSNARKVSATGLALPVYVALGYRISPTIALGGALSLAIQPSPSIDFELIGAGTPVPADGGAFGGVIGPMVAFQASEHLEVNAAIGYGGFGRSSPNPSFGGKGFMYTADIEYQVPTTPSLALLIGLRFTGGFMSYDAGAEGSYSSTLILPALMAGFVLR